jgi:hypothetical protein
MSFIGGMLSDFRLYSQLVANRVSPPLILEQDKRLALLNAVACLRGIAKNLHMVAAVAAGEDAFEYYRRMFEAEDSFGSFELNNLFGPGDRLLHAFASEMEARLVFVMPSAHARFYNDDEPLFGEDVENAFPSSAPEITEAGKCRALGRWTACVMHLMRALEPALLALQNAVQVNVPKEQWDQIINQVEAKIREITKRTHGKADEQWFSEAASHFRLIKNAWRNHAQHLHERYDEERAVVIYDSVRAFMRHLATKLHE